MVATSALAVKIGSGSAAGKFVVEFKGRGNHVRQNVGRPAPWRMQLQFGTPRVLANAVTIFDGTLSTWRLPRFAIRRFQILSIPP
jgi:hypothetical protein